LKKVAVLLDGGYVTYQLTKANDYTFPTAREVWEYARACIHDGEELFRIYYYDCPPYGGIARHPLTGEEIDFGQTIINQRRTKYLEELSHLDFVALRRGELAFSGWVLTRKATEEMIATKRFLAHGDLEPAFRQKMVDVRFGLDVAWLASKKIVDRIVLVTGDSDFIPAMKFARYEGIQVVLVTMGNPNVDTEMLAHSDELRTVRNPMLRNRLRREAAALRPVPRMGARGPGSDGAPPPQEASGPE